MTLAASRPQGAATRFAGLHPLVAAAILAALALLVGVGAHQVLPAFNGTQAATARFGDLALYRTIAARIGQGQGYYAAAAAEHRAHGFPLRPFVAVRLPTLAEIIGHLGRPGAIALLDSLVLAAWLGFTLRVRSLLPLVSSAAASCALSKGLAVFLVPDAVFLHESWAATLLVLSLALRSRDRFLASVVLGVAACAVRELAFPYLCVMLVAATIDGTRREVATWLAAICFFVGLLVAHAAAIGALTHPHDMASPGWMAAGGWPFILAMLRYSPLLTELPTALLALVVPLALLGWIAWRDAIGLRGALLLCGYAAAFMLVGRPDNDYWGLMLVPLLLIGLVFSPAALGDLLCACRKPWSRPVARPA